MYENSNLNLQDLILSLSDTILLENLRRSGDDITNIKENQIYIVINTKQFGEQRLTSKEWKDRPKEEACKLVYDNKHGPAIEFLESGLKIWFIDGSWTRPDEAIERLDIPFEKLVEYTFDVSDMHREAALKKIKALKGEQDE